MTTSLIIVSTAVLFFLATMYFVDSVVSRFKKKKSGLRLEPVHAEAEMDLAHR
ncbi:hypothetical protein [Halalkalibacillus halophilus]|uniref:hypothetical protein n=1 Tax=Halalkalibacillus halophilus TaxID=392827 RepID=UPI00041C732F|nr:hypothetical protein [Halalkalibacillus halophilus]